jgi:mono/diheme cytochrome c family protein
MKASSGLLLCVLLVPAAGLPAPGEKAHLAIGRDLYRENCAVCHDIDKDKMHSRKFGPSLQRLFKNETLPMSHGKPTRPYVEVRIKFGGAIMPAFGKRLTQDEINTLIDYIDSK